MSWATSTLISSNLKPVIFLITFCYPCKVTPFFPAIDKPTRVHNNSATLIDNILVNRIGFKLSSGNIVSDISDHYSQFCIIHSPSLKSRYQGTKIRDYSRFSEENFISDISQTDWTGLISNGSIDKRFSSFYNRLNKIVNRHAPLKFDQNARPSNYLNRG